MMYVCICVYYIERWSVPNQSAQCIRIDKRHIFKNAKKNSNIHATLSFMQEQSSDINHQSFMVIIMLRKSCFC